MSILVLHRDIMQNPVLLTAELSFSVACGCSEEEEDPQVEGNGRKYCREIMRERVEEEMKQLIFPFPRGCLCWAVFGGLVFLIFIFSYCI